MHCMIRTICRVGESNMKGPQMSRTCVQYHTNRNWGDIVTYDDTPIDFLAGEIEDGGECAPGLRPIVTYDAANRVMCVRYPDGPANTWPNLGVVYVFPNVTDDEHRAVIAFIDRVYAA